jgi:hypothetical protein
MGAGDIIVGLAAIIAGCASLIRQGAPVAPRWRLRLAAWADAVSLAAVATLAACDHSTLLDTPLAVVAAFSAWELALCVLDLRGWAGRRTPHWLA